MPDFPPKQPERIVSAAIRKMGLWEKDQTSPEYLIVLGVRHFDSIMRMQINNYTGWEQGFITNKYRFVSREEAWKIAKEQDQLCWGKDRTDGQLFSEDLY